MNKYPKLKFQLNIQLDIDIASMFIDMNSGGMDYSKKIIGAHPELSKAKEVTGDERRAVIANFTKDYYEGNKAGLEINLSRINSDWESVADDYFRGVDEIFNNAQWPQGEYICYLSIFNCNPRFLETRSFQVYQGLSDRTNYIIAHEMLHFMFFDYLDNHEADFKNKQDEHTIWLLSEWFNDLTLNLPIFKQFGENVKSAYPEVVEFSKQFKVGKGQIKDVKSFFQTIKTVISA